MRPGHQTEGHIQTQSAHIRINIIRKVKGLCIIALL